MIKWGRCWSCALLLLVLLAVVCYAQPRYWIALNFDLHFRRDGVVVVRALLHPFTLEGESLYGNLTVEKELRRGQNVTVNEIALMFTNDPSSLRYKVLELLHPEEGAVVYCDVYGYGEFEELKGAYVITVAVYLNTSEFVSVEDGVVTVRVRDSYTSRDPRSWIDVLRASFDEGLLLSYSWLPSGAGEPSQKGDALIWTNLNEPEAPDFYVFKLKLPGFELAKLPPRLVARIVEAETVDSSAMVMLCAERGGGYAFVRLVEEGGEQVRKVYLGEGESIKVSFRYVEKPLRVEVWAGRLKLAEAPLTRARASFLRLSPRRMLGATLIVVATVLAAAAVIRGRAKLRTLSRSAGLSSYEEPREVSEA